MQKEMTAEKYIAKRYGLKLMDLDSLPYSTWIQDSDDMERKNEEKTVFFLKKYLGARKEQKEWDEIYDGILRDNTL